jgi:type II secretory pathway component PulL
MFLVVVSWFSGIKDTICVVTETEELAREWIEKEMKGMEYNGMGVHKIIPVALYNPNETKKYTVEEIKAYAQSWLKSSLSSDSFFSGETENKRLEAFMHYIDVPNDSDNIENFLRKRKEKTL